MNQTLLFILFLSFTTLSINLEGQVKTVNKNKYKSPSEVWDDWRKNKCNFDVKSIGEPDKRKKADLLMYNLINGYHEFCHDKLEIVYNYLEIM